MPQKNSRKTGSARGPGRPKGKRSDPNYMSMTVLIRKSTHRELKAALLDQDQPEEMGEVVDRLIENWLSKRPRS